MSEPDPYDETNWNELGADMELNVHVLDRTGHYVVEQRIDGETRNVGSGAGLSNALEDLAEEIWSP